MNDEEKKAAEAAKAKAEAEKAKVKPVKDSVAKGSQDLFGPYLFKEGAELVKLIRAGEADGVLSELLQLEQGHGRREIVIDALRQRGAVEPKAD